MNDRILKLSLKYQLSRGFNKFHQETIELQELENRLQVTNAHLDAILSSRGWRLLEILYKIRTLLIPHRSAREKILRWIYHSLRGKYQPVSKFSGNADQAMPSSYPAHQEAAYQEWIRLNEPDDDALLGQFLQSISLPHPPLISIVIPVYRVPINVLRMTIDSVLYQTYPFWELCIANGNPQDEEISTLLKEYREQDPRIKVVALEQNYGIAINTNRALSLATGSFVGFLDHDDVLAPFALYEVADVINSATQVDVIYSDEDHISLNGRKRYEPYFKPAFCPYTLRSINLMPHFLVIRRKLGEEIGWFRDGYNGAQDYDLVLRAVEKSRAIAHLPKVLYHWRAISGSTALDVHSKEYASEAGIKVLSDHLARNRIIGHVAPGPVPTTYRIHYGISNSPLVSIVISNFDDKDQLYKCISSILDISNYKNIEILVVLSDNHDVLASRELRDFEKRTNFRVLLQDSSSQLAIINNYAANHALGEFLLFLDGTVEVINPNWLENMLEYGLQKDVGVVGSKIYSPNHTILEAGMVVGQDQGAYPIHCGSSGEFSGYLFRLWLPQNVSAVSNACMLVRKPVFESMGGFDPEMKGLGDVDFCLRLGEKGYQVIWTPFSELVIHRDHLPLDIEKGLLSKSFRQEIPGFFTKWQRILSDGDHCSNPNIRLLKEVEINVESITQLRARITSGTVIELPHDDNHHDR